MDSPTDSHNQSNENKQSAKKESNWKICCEALMVIVTCPCWVPYLLCSLCGYAINPGRC
jgi:hypothetical protein